MLQVQSWWSILASIQAWLISMVSILRNYLVSTSVSRCKLTLMKPKSPRFLMQNRSITSRQYCRVVRAKNHQGVAIALLYYSLLWMNEVKKFTIDNIIIKSDPKDIEVTFYHTIKKRNEGFMFNVPLTFYDMFVKYVKQLCPNAVKQGMRQFLKNWNSCVKHRIQKMGRNNLNILQEAACSILKRSKNGYISHY